MRFTQTTCPVGSAAGHDGDECRANLAEDGSILCVICATVYPKMSDRVTRIYRKIAACYGVPKVELGSNIQPGTDAYNGSCLSGYDPAQSDRVRAAFSHSGETCVLQYERHNQAELDNPDLKVGRKLSSDELALIPRRMQNCIAGLESEGFVVRHVSNERGLRIVMSAGRSIGSMGFVLGASIELTTNF